MASRSLTMSRRTVIGFQGSGSHKLQGLRKFSVRTTRTGKSVTSCDTRSRILSALHLYRTHARWRTRRCDAGRPQASCKWRTGNDDWLGSLRCLHPPPPPRRLPGCWMPLPGNIKLHLQRPTQVAALGTKSSLQSSFASQCAPPSFFLLQGSRLHHRAHCRISSKIPSRRPSIHTQLTSHGVFFR